MARTTIHLVQLPHLKHQLKQIDFDSTEVSLEAYGAVLRNQRLPDGSSGTKVIPWHRIAEVVQAPDRP